MSNEEELEEIRRRKLAQLQQQAARQEIAEQQRNEFEKKKYHIMRKILDPEGRQRLENIRIVKPEFAQQIELQLIQLYQTGRLKGATPLPDKAFKGLLEQITRSEKKKDFKIKNL
ncbi:MAG: DNA-binding protein [Promethearchaeota archaeon]